MPKTIEGVLTAIVTPFTATGSLNIPALKVQLNRQLEAGNAIFCGGTNGEFFVLNVQEKLSVTQTCVDEVAGRAPVVAHIGEISTRETIRLGQQIEKLGVDAVIAPYFVPLKQEELIAHYSAIADALSIPMFLYNIPARTGNTIQPETARALASHPNIIGIKDSAGSDESLKGFLDAVCDIDGFNVLNGPDSLIHKGFVEGCSACISGLANVKKALQLMGHDVGDSRYAVNFTPEQISEIQQIIRHYNIN